MSLFRTLLRVTVEHSYNSSGVCLCLNFRPTHETSKLIANLGLVYKKNGGGIVIAYDEECREALEMLAREEPASFDFKVYATDPDFKSYSEPYGGRDDHMLYFDNRRTDGSGAQDLAASGTVSDRDIIAADAAELDGMLSSGDRLYPPVFVLRMFTGDKGKLLSQWLKAVPGEYTIRFASRQRHWKYYLLGKLVRQNGSGGRFEIVDPEHKIEFETMGEEMLSDQRIAYIFRSKQQIPLNEFYTYRFQLKQKGQNGDTVIMPSLPYASLKQIGTDTVEKQQTIVSEIYINS